MNVYLIFTTYYYEGKFFEETLHSIWSEEKNAVQFLKEAGYRLNVDRNVFETVDPDLYYPMTNVKSIRVKTVDKFICEIQNIPNFL